MPGRNDNGPEKYFGDREGTEKANYHIVPHDGDWALKLEGEEEPVETGGDRDQLVEEGKKRAGEHGAIVIVHDKEGQIENQIEC
ncbi:DUF2188 domain-containing protein [Edaphobacillus lindanitolerans]|uniref:DUF2188 domain-containing protein n=1 Tax=Edaphobacillus lindanitolerans TaxID=550447 RepID=A0A1U7PND8_9BACI|nr:DUF2188 domain-containing protein [Edaphobacillus lindanitolerans]SIT84299.1 hypothetical protein SAMN05428946_1707 [Edaphobacillus lindanitolerans]